MRERRHVGMCGIYPFRHAGDSGDGRGYIQGPDERGAVRGRDFLGQPLGLSGKGKGFHLKGLHHKLHPPRVRVPFRGDEGSGHLRIPGEQQRAGHPDGPSPEIRLRLPGDRACGFRERSGSVWKERRKEDIPPRQGVQHGKDHQYRSGSGQRFPDYAHLRHRFYRRREKQYRL